MAGTKRPAPLVVEALEWLQREPYKFDFVQALRLLECAHADRPRLGETSRAGEERVRLAQLASLAFAPATIAAAETDAGGRLRLEVSFLGLLGPNGPLPLHLTEYVRDRTRNEGDWTLVRFLDIFHHRALSLFYRASASGRAAISLDRPDEDRFSLYIGSLIGLGLPTVRGRDAVSDWAKQSFAGHLVRHARNSEGLRDILEDFLQLPVSIDEFVGHWIELPADGCLRLGTTPDQGVLGESFTIGARIWDCQYKFRVVVGPIDFEDFKRLLPEGKSLSRVVALVRNYVGDEFAWDLQLILKKQEVPPFELGSQGRLGYTMWLGSRPPDRDPDDLCLDESRAKSRRRATVGS
jgi:type VI secretion system protein ImpH